MSSKTKTSLMNRRTFIGQVAAACAAFGAASHSPAQTTLSETDSQAIALGYKADAGKVDKIKQPKYAAGQLCANCALYQGAAGSSSGACPLFGSKAVAAKGWCSAWVKKTP